MHRNVIDFRACAKHAYYGAKDPESIRCEKTGRNYPHWQVGAADFITRYINPLIIDGEDSPRSIVVAHDMGRKFRTTIFPEYKGQKEKQDENKSPIEIEQYKLLMDWLKKFFTALGVVQIGVDGVEADDVMAWIVEGQEKVGASTTIFTVDEDMFALISDLTSVSIKNEIHYGADGVYPEGHSLAGLPYRLTSFYKSIMGDKSDNYKGVLGMGADKIKKLAEAYGIDGLEELEQIVSSGNTDLLDETIEATGDKKLIKLKENFADWRTSYRVAILRPELCWKPRARQLVKPMVHKRIPSAAAMHHLLKLVGCEDLWESDQGSEGGSVGFDQFFPAPFAVTAENWGELREDILAAIAASPLVSFDYESSDKSPIMAFRYASTRGENFVDNLSQVIAGASFQFGKHLEDVIYIPVDHYNSPNLPAAVITEILMCAAKNSQLVAHNAYFEGIVTQTNLGFWLENVHDTRVMQRYLDENAEAGLKFMSDEYLNYQQTSYADTIGAAKQWEQDTGEPAKRMCELTLDETFSYGSDDALVTGHLYDLVQFLLVLDGQWEQYLRFAVRPTEVLQRAYVHGTNMNWALQRRLHERDLKQIEDGMATLRDILQKNVTGNITAGAKSLIDAERDYIYRSALNKASAAGSPDAKGAASEKLSEWRRKIEAACQYTPYRVEKVMPQFAFTVNQINPALVESGLPELETLSHKAWQAYLEQIGAIGFDDDWPAGVRNCAPLIRQIGLCLNSGVLRRSDTRKKINELAEKEASEANEQQIAVLGKDLQRAEDAVEALGKMVQAIAKVEPRLVEFGDALNVGSPAQMQQLLYCKIGVPVRLRGKKAGKGRLMIGIKEAGPATDEKAVETALANDIGAEAWQRDALKALLAVKSASTRCSLYHDKYPLWRHRDGLVHAYITWCGTDTRRPTGSSPNELQVSKKAPEMRSQYIPPNPDFVCVAIDFNGQEIRLMANLANDPVMMSVYDPADEKDLHSMTGAAISNIAYDVFRLALNDKEHNQHKAAKDARKSAKGVNFGMAYGSGAGTLSRNLIVPKETAQELLDKTMDLYSRIRPWQQETAKFMETYGYTLTAFGSKRHATADIFSKDNGKVSRQHRQGTNFTIQGTAADMLGLVLTRVAESGMMDRLRMVFFAPIYDEIVSWVHKDDVLEYCREMGRYMEESTPPGHKVRQVPEYSIGCDWGQLHELGRDISPENVAKYVALALEDGKSIWDDVKEPFDPILKKTYLELSEDELEEVELEPDFA